MPKSGDTAWNLGEPGTAGNVCMLLGLSPAVEQYLAEGEPGSGIGLRSGIKGFWSQLVDGIGLSHTRNNSYDTSSGAEWQDPSAAVADFTLLSADAAAGDPSVSISTIATTDLAALWADFASDGTFESADSWNGSMATHGAIAASTLLQPGETRTITLVFSWYLPYHLYVGQELGNEYAQRFQSSEEVARQVANNLTDIVAGGAQWNAACTNNSLPEWMQVPIYILSYICVDDSSKPPFFAGPTC